MLEWQAGYGVVSFGTKDLAWVKQYIQNQRSRHATGKIINRLEHITELEAVIPGGNPLNGVDTPDDRERGPAQVRLTRHKCRAYYYRLKPKTGVNARPSSPSRNKNGTKRNMRFPPRPSDICAGQSHPTGYAK